jgi:CxxC-x17-CxxC domain-containing protein
MSFVDKSLKCSDCGADFTFTSSEQDFFAEKGYTNDPKRCQLCRATRKAQNNNSSGYSQPRRQMYPATCSECGKSTELPFEPRDGRPVYCRECYSRVKPSPSRY